MDQVYEEVRRRYPEIGRATVYRNLLQLSEEGKIRSVTLPASPMRYEERTLTHYHFRCKKCDDIIDIDADFVIDDDALISENPDADGLAAIAAKAKVALSGGLTQVYRPMAKKLIKIRSKPSNEIEDSIIDKSFGIGDDEAMIKD